MTTFATLFSGIEGWGLGAERAGFTQLWACEIAPFPRKVLAARRPGLRVYDDITRLHARHAHVLQPHGTGADVLRDGDAARDEQLPAECPDCCDRPDVLIASPPCQDLSVAGRRAGLAGARSGLFYDFARLAGELQPSWICMEQVPGLLSSNGGRDFAEVLRTLDELGFGLSWRTLDSRYLGVPQRRRRIYLVGRLGEPCPAEVLFEPEGGGGNPAARGAAGADVAGTLGGGAPGARGWRGDLDSAANPEDDETWVRSEEANTLNGFDVGDVRTTTAITAAASVRRLTPTECERLQGFADGWTCTCGVAPYDTNTCACADGPRYAALGNAVTVNAAAWVLRRLAAVEHAA
jgi:DNA (cytosine-5)-methyltransferase 1